MHELKFMCDKDKSIFFKCANSIHKQNTHIK